MMPRRDAKNGGSTAKYHRMTRGGGDDDFVDSQFESPPPKIPIKAIMLSIVLFVGGTSLIVIGALLLTGYIDAKYSDRTWPLLLLGGLMFIPGAYHVRIAYYAWKGYRGYSYDDIPEYD